MALGLSGVLAACTGGIAAEPMLVVGRSVTCQVIGSGTHGFRIESGPRGMAEDCDLPFNQGIPAVLSYQIVVQPPRTEAFTTVVSRECYLKIRVGDQWPTDREECR